MSGGCLPSDKEMGVQRGLSQVPREQIGTNKQSSGTIVIDVKRTSQERKGNVIIFLTIKFTE